MNTRSGFRTLVSIGASVFTVACVDTGVSSTSAELFVAGDTSLAISARDGWQLTLERAQLAFGPLWLCPGNTAGELCDVARAEWLESVVVDALDDKANSVGEIWGNAGAVRSWMYDYGLVSRLTHKEPYRTEAADVLDGNSVRIRGCATKEVRKLCFELELPVAQSTTAEQGVPVVRVSGNGSALAHFGSVRRVTALFDAADWLQTVDFEALALQQACEQDCAVVELDADSQAGRAVRSALEGTARPELVWR